MWLRAVRLLLAAIFLCAAAGCAGKKKSVKNRPVQPISSLASRRAQNDNPVLKEIKGAGKATLNGVGWVIKEFLSPLEALRKGMVNTFGVTTEETIEQRNVPPRAFQQ